MISFGSSIHAQCLVEGENIIYTPNPSNTVVNNGTEWVKLYIHVCERNATNPTLSDQEVANMIAEANTDFSAAGIQFFYCMDRIYNDEFISSESFFVSELYDECVDHTDGIDIYLLPKDYVKDPTNNTVFLSGGGFAFSYENGPSTNFSSIPASDIFFWGKTTICEYPYFTPNTRTCQIPHFLSHELGHCFGLFHTHENIFGITLPDNSNWQTSGDFLEDTNPELNLQFCVNQSCTEVFHNFTTSCIEIQQTHVPSSIYTNPNLDNIMSFTNYEHCDVIFSADQNNQMLTTLQNNPLLQNFRYKTNFGDVTINGTEVWPLADFPSSGNVIIRGNLIINPSASLNITNGSIQFSEMGIAAIRPGGLLEVGNATLSAECGIWQGVRVGGNNSLAQSTATHGQLRLNSGAVIEHAYTGAASTYGGIISTDQAVFRNNFNGVYLGRYAQKHTLTNFDRTLFTRDRCDRFFNVPVFFPANRTHATLDNVTGNQFINFNGCTFNDEGDKDKKPVNYGISSSNSDLRVRNYITSTIPVESFFDNLSTGVSHNLKKVRGLEVTGSTFNKCDIGIYASTSGRVFLQDNTFNLGTINPNPNSLFTVQMGAWVRNNIPSVTLHMNHFIASGESKVITIGSFAQDLGTYSNFIRGNDYQNNTIGNLSNGNNGGSESGLMYLCNDNTGLQSYDFSVVEQSTIRELQGVGAPTGGVLAVGNTFSYSNGNNGDQSDFSNNGSGQVRYYYAPSPSMEPLDFFGIDKEEVEIFACEVGKPDPENDRDLELLKQDYYTQRGIYQNTEILYNQAAQTSNTIQAEQKKRELTFTRQIMDEAVGHIISYENNHANNPDTIRKWMSNYDRFAADQHVAFHFYQYGKVASADSFLQILPLRYNLSTAEAADLSAMRQVISILPNPAILLNEAQVQQLETIASGPQAYFSTDWARSELSQYGRYYKPDYILPEIGTKERSEQGQNLGSNTSMNHLYPNPAHTTLQVVIEHPDQTGNIQVFDSFGRLLGKYAVPVGTPIYTFDSSNWPSGMYVIQYEQSSMPQFTERVFVQH